MEIDRKRADLKDNPRLLSPPSLDSLYQCATTVVVRGYVPHSDIDVDVAGVVTPFPDVGVPAGDGVVLTLPAALVAGQQFRVRQRLGPARSPYTDPQTVRDHTAEFPAGLPRPTVDAPVYECGAAVAVNNLLTGSVATVFADGAAVGKSPGGSAYRAIRVSSDFAKGQVVTAVAELCGDTSQPSAGQVAQPRLSRMPAPNVEPFYDGADLPGSSLPAPTVAPMQWSSRPSSPTHFLQGLSFYRLLTATFPMLFAVTSPGSELRAVTRTPPSSSTDRVTWIRGMPRGAGGIFSM